MLHQNYVFQMKIELIEKTVHLLPNADENMEKLKVSFFSVNSQFENFWLISKLKIINSTTSFSVAVSIFFTI